MKPLSKNGLMRRVAARFGYVQRDEQVTEGITTLLPPPKPIVIGIPSEIKPVRGVDAKAEAKLVLRHGQPAELTMLTDGQDSTFTLEDRGDYWLVDQEVRREILIK